MSPRRQETASAVRSSVGAPPVLAKSWNVVVTAFSEGWRPALRALRQLGEAQASGHYNVILATADDPVGLLDALERRAQTEPVLIDTISRVAPALACFDYQTDEDFERKAIAVAMPWLPKLAGKSFHVRVHRRGDGLSSNVQAEEARLGQALLSALADIGATASIKFEDPDLILAIDAIDGRAGVGLWTREDMRRRRFLRPD